MLSYIVRRYCTKPFLNVSLQERPTFILKPSFITTSELTASNLLTCMQLIRQLLCTLMKLYPVSLSLIHIQMCIRDRSNTMRSLFGQKEYTRLISEESILSSLLSLTMELPNVHCRRTSFFSPGTTTLRESFDEYIVTPLCALSSSDKKTNIDGEKLTTLSDTFSNSIAVSYTHLDVYKRQHIHHQCQSSEFCQQ